MPAAAGAYGGSCRTDPDEKLFQSIPAGGGLASGWPAKWMAGEETAGVTPLPLRPKI